MDQIDSVLEEQTEKPAAVELPTPEKLEPLNSDDGDYEEYYDEDDEYDDETSDEDYDDEEEESDEDEEEDEEDEPEEPAVPIIDGTQLKSTQWDDEIDEDEHDLPAPQVIPAHMGANRIEVAQMEKKSAVHLGKAGLSNMSYTLGLAVAGIAVFVILVAGIVVLRRKNAGRAQQNHGFVEIDQAAVSPEERHVANMQMNGYENPTYKYFESNA